MLPINRVDFAVKRGTTSPITFVIVDGKGYVHPSLKHLDSAILVITPTSGDAVKVPLTVKPNTINSDGGVGTVLTAEQTTAWTWRWARYEVQVEIKGIRAVVYEGNLNLENNLGV